MSKKRTKQIYLAAGIFAVVVGYYVYSNWQGNPLLGIQGINLNVSHFDVSFTRFRCAESLRRASTEELVVEVRKIIDQNGLPADVFTDDTVGYERRDEQPPPNIAILLHDRFHLFYDLLEPNDSLDRLWDASPIGEWDIDEQTLESVRETLDRLESIRQDIRTALKRPRTRFYYIFIYPESLGSRFDVGVTINTEASRYLADYALLEEYAIAQALLDGNMGAAIDALAYIFRIAYLATHLRNVGTRTDAAVTRLRAFDVMQRVILDPNFDQTHMITLRNMLFEERRNWISEYDTWFGDRASGIILYHRALTFGPNEAFEDAELDELERRITLRTFYRGFGRYHEADQAFYLRSMQKILDVSREPFVRRLDVLDQIYGELRRKENTFDEDGISMEPFVAGLLLQDVESLMEHFARDESALNRALVLMDASLGQNNLDRYRDPFTDEPFEIRRVDGLLSITTPHLPRPFRVPVFVERE